MALLIIGPWADEGEKQDSRVYLIIFVIMVELIEKM